jgi:hypothetical protein
MFLLFSENDRENAMATMAGVAAIPPGDSLPWKLLPLHPLTVLLDRQQRMLQWRHQQ